MALIRPTCPEKNVKLVVALSKIVLNLFFCDTIQF
jgi:hypothetical protein